MKRTAYALTITVALAIVSWSLFDRISPRTSAEPLELSVATGSPMLSALLFLAEEQGLFHKHGLNVQLQVEPTGKAAVAQLLSGSVDAAMAAEFVFASQSGANPGLLTLGSVARVQNIQFAALIERGIAGPEAFRGLRFGLARGTQAEYFLGLTLSQLGLGIDDVSLVDLKPEVLEDALTAGKVDAVVVWEPFIHRLKGAFGKRLVTWPAQADRDYYWSLMTTGQVLARGEEPFRRFFRALVEAELLAVRTPRVLNAVIEKVSGEPALFYEEVLPRYRYRVSAEQGLLLALEAEWRWLARVGVVDDDAAPDFLSRIRTGPLMDAAPEKVTLRSVGNGR